MSDGGENAILIGEKGLSLRGGETICMDADVATALQLVLRDSGLTYLLAERGAEDVTSTNKYTVGRLVRPLVEQIGETRLTIGVAFGGASKGKLSSNDSRGRARGAGTLRKEQIKAEMSLGLQEKRRVTKRRHHQKGSEEMKGRYEMPGEMSQL